MSKKSQIKKIQFTRDFLPSEFTEDKELHSYRFQHIEAIARDVFQRYGFSEIRTPIFEHTELFARGVGEDTDIVSKEMFTWKDVPDKYGRSDSLTLRPENTASVIRAYIEHKMWTQSELAKLYYIGPMFRREHGQKGRYRQFYQIGAEVIGKSDHPAIEAEVIELITVMLKELRITNTTLLVNSVGCPNCRPAFNEKLRSEIEPRLARMCEDCNRRFKTNILRVLDCKIDTEVVAELPSIQDSLCEECRTHFTEFRRLLDARGIEYTVEAKLVRGLDYYTRTAFEILGGNLGAQNALLGGGRYDGLSETLGGPPTKGFGFALGLDRFVMSLPEDVEDPAIPTLFIAPLGQAAFDFALLLAGRLRQGGISCALDFDLRSLKSSMRLADKTKAKYVLILGDEELAKSQFMLRNMSTKAQQEVTEAELIEKLKARD